MRRLLVSAALLLSVTAPGRAHSWYEPECCSGIDCRPVADSDIKHTATGYTYDGLAFDKTMERPSRDGKYHVCIHTWAGEDGSLGRSPRCIYVPMFW